MAVGGHVGCPNLLSMAFLAISYQYETFLYFFFRKWPPTPILDVRNLLLIAFLAISDRYATLICFESFDKMTAVGHFRCPRLTFDRISGHFRSIRNFFFFGIF